MKLVLSKTVVWN